MAAETFYSNDDAAQWRRWSPRMLYGKAPLQISAIPAAEQRVKAILTAIKCCGLPVLAGASMIRKGTTMRNLMTSITATLALAGCTDADVASRNLSKAADQFEVSRRVVFYNGITGDYILSIEGLCSLGNKDTDGRLSVTCKTGTETYKKHFLGLSDNVTFFAEQLEPAKTSRTTTV